MSSNKSVSTSDNGERRMPEQTEPTYCRRPFQRIRSVIINSVAITSPYPLMNAIHCAILCEAVQMRLDFASDLALRASFALRNLDIRYFEIASRQSRPDTMAQCRSGQITHAKLAV